VHDSLLLAYMLQGVPYALQTDRITDQAKLKNLQ
jgi:hypothetical protein